jgi:glycosyltransferase involved in cell wall biosynthesis
MTKGAPVRRLLMTADAVGGVWTFALELAAGLAERGVETRLAVLGPPPNADQQRQAAAIPGLELVVTGHDLEWRDKRGLLDWGGRQRLRALAEDFRPDIVHVNGFREAACRWPAPVVVVAHSCVRSWWRACRACEPPLEWSAYSAAVQIGLDAADAVVAPTRSFLGELELLYGALPRGRAIQNGRTLATPLRRTRKPVILAAGRLWDEGKNIAALARVAPRLPWPVAVAGEAPRGGTLPGLVHLGRLDEDALVHAMAEAEIFCAPALYEPFGLAVLEAAISGAALVLSTAPSFVELWGEAARFVDPDDLDGLAGTLLDLIEDPLARKQLQRAAKETAAAYGRDRMTEAYLGLYAELAAGRPRAGARAA